MAHHRKLASMSEAHFWYIWFAVWMAIAIGGTFLAGFFTGATKRQKEDIIAASVVCGFMWPFILIGILMVAPIYGIFLVIYKLGEYIRHRVEGNDVRNL